MAKNAPGKHFREGLSLFDLLRMFPNDAEAERWFVKQRWANGVFCPHCGSVEITERKNRKPQPYHCRSCRKYFSVRTGTPMHASNLGFQTWAIAFYLLATGIKGTSSMKLHRDLKITQKSAWHLAHRIRETWDNAQSPFGGPVEVDETYMGGRERNKHGDKKLHQQGGFLGKTLVAGAKDRETNRIDAEIIANTDKGTLHRFVKDRTADDATVYTDGYKGYNDLPFNHESVNHAKGEYVKGDAHTNGIEGFWAMLKRGHKGTYHKMSPKHLQRYVNEFSGRHNIRPMDTLDQMGAMVASMERKRLRYEDLIADNGLDSQAKSV